MPTKSCVGGGGEILLPRGQPPPHTHTTKEDLKPPFKRGLKKRRGEGRGVPWKTCVSHIKRYFAREIKGKGKGEKEKILGLEENKKSFFYSDHQRGRYRLKEKEKMGEFWPWRWRLLSGEEEEDFLGGGGGGGVCVCVEMQKFYRSQRKRRRGKIFARLLVVVCLLPGIFMLAPVWGIIDLSLPPPQRSPLGQQMMLPRPILVHIIRSTPSVTTLVVASHGVEIWVALRFSYH